MTAFTMLFIFCIILALGAPIGTAMCVSSVFTLLTSHMNFTMIPYNYYAATTKFVLLAIPFFVLGGNIMERSGISTRLIDLAQSFVGHKKGGLALVCILVTCFFAAISGSGPATVAALGVIIIPAMVKVGYTKGDASALMATAGGIGMIIPPSIPFVVYSAIAGISTGTLFLAGILPGIIMGFALFLASRWVTRKSDLIEVKKASSKDRWESFKSAFWGLLMPAIILGGIYGGIFTATEAAAVSVIYGLFVGIFIYRSLKLTDILDVFVQSARQTGSIMWTVGNAALMSWVLTVSGIATSVSNWLMLVTNGHVVILLLIFNIVILFAGCFIDGNSIMYIFVPIFLPVALQLGYNPYVLGVVLVMNIAIGLVTPPVGSNLFVAISISKINVSEIVKPLIPYIIATVAVLILITYVPEVTLFIPKLLGEL